MPFVRTLRRGGGRGLPSFRGMLMPKRAITGSGDSLPGDEDRHQLGRGDIRSGITPCIGSGPYGTGMRSYNEDIYDHRQLDAKYER
jgi:hypothetical protein